MNKLTIHDIIMEVDKINIDTLDLQGRLIECDQMEYVKILNKLTDMFDKILDELEALDNE